MYLKRIELQGFKSFPEKIRLEFNKGITAVVGPNGSGKSNIADAVRWVLGEQSAKSLRGSRMEDIIFAGTANRRQLGFAEVILVIDNADRRLDIDYSEISVTRRVYRSGESEYRINGTACRLKDIHEMFMDTGIGREGYSIIGQGRIEEILSTRSEDRRLLFEEAAGIVKYKNRKHETEQKLERERQNLLRVADIITELEHKLMPLRRQSDTAKAYLTLKERLKLLQVNIFLYNADKSEAELRAIDEDIAALAEQYAVQKARQAECEAAVARLKAEMAGLTGEANLHMEELAETRVKVESCEGEARLGEEQINGIKSAIGRIDAGVGESLARAAMLEQDGQRERERLEEIERRLWQADESLSEKQRAFEDVTRRMNEGEQRIEQFNAQIISEMKKVSDTRAQTQRAKAAYERLEELKESLNDEREANRERNEKNSALLSELVAQQAEAEAEAEKLGADIEQLMDEKESNTAEMSKVSQGLRALQKTLNDSISRHRLLTELEVGYEGYLKSVKAVLKSKNRLSGICGAVAQLLDVEARYETCIEVALGAAAQNIITRTEEDAVAAIEYLKANNEGRVTFLPLTAIKARELGGERERIMSERGVCGTAKELTRYDAAYENVFSSLLGRVLVVDGIENAVRLARKYRHTYKIVTLMGELFSIGGAMTGGSTQRVTSLFGRSREIKELKQRIDGVTAEVAAAEAQENTYRRQLGIINEQTDEKRALLQQNALNRATLAQSLAQARELAETLARQQAQIEAKDAELMERLIASNLEVRAYEDAIAENEREIESLHRQLDAFQSTMITEKDEKEEGIKELLKVKTEVSALEQNCNAARENIKRIEADTSAVQDTLAKHYAELEALRTRMAKAEDKLSAIRSRAEELRERQAELMTQLARLNEAEAEKSEELAQAELSEREAMAVISGLNEENVRLGMKREQLTENNRRLYDEMWDEYEITYQTAAQYERLNATSAQLMREERAVKAEIQGLGDVNVGAIEEYKAVKARYEFLTQQREDILAAEDRLMQIISELTAQMERQFTEQFRLMSENFAFVFREMFGGGDACLKLLDGKSVLEAGIDIVARPPGKTLQSMSLLSGGERALTATALLFGILRMKPSPFCVLDEVEAALDDSNVARYADYLKRYSQETQFILITHRKGTMEAADVLYGVTMQEQGISKLVSVKFDE